jgi:uncharacterized protein with HEPN domain
MENRTKVWLADIKQAIVEINQFLPEKRDFFQFQKDIKTKKAVERNIEIIGEAVNRILIQNPEIQISNAKKIVATRNRVIHNYDSISQDIIWTIINRDLPLLEKEIDALLNQ